MMQKEIKTSFGEKIISFIQRNRKGILFSVCTVFILLIGVIILVSVQDVLRKKAINEVEELNSKYEEIRYFIINDYNSSDLNELLSELDTFNKKNKKGFAGGKAWSITAQIYSAKEDWYNAEEAWLNSAKMGDKTYLAPLALFNAAVAAEELGKLEQAIVYLEKAIAHPYEFPSAPRAQFSIGRLYEQLNNYPAAAEAYRSVLINWQNIPIWPHLARSRIIAIEEVR
jgi:tetratricopeptide (TPR) repeat protein